MSFLDNNSSIGNFCNNIAGGMSKAFLGSENTKRSLSDAAQRLFETLDKTAHRTYINSGFSNNKKTKPSNRNIITQTPELIVLIKKKMFSSLSDNYGFEFMDKEEKHFIRAAKKLFENKCEDISNYEKLTKLNKIIQDNQVLNSPMAQIIYQTLSTLDAAEYNLNETLGPKETAMPIPGSASYGYTEDILKNRNVTKRIRQLLTLNGFNQTTTWIKDSNFEERNSDGIGTGVIELTLVKSASFTNSLEFESGSGTLQISDPYKLFFIDEADIEKAIYQTAKVKFTTLDTLGDLLNQDNDEFKQTLNQLRISRGASSITYKIEIATRVYNRVTIILDRIGLELTKADGSGIDYEKLENSNVPAFEQFTREEKTLLDDIYKNIFRILQSKTRNYEDYRKYNYDSNSVRKQMRLNFMGKQIIQPMDTVTAFIDSQTIDDKLLSFEIKQSFLNSSANVITGKLKLPNIAANAAATMGSTNLTGLLAKTVGQINQLSQLQAEKAILAGPDFPDWIYTALRPNFTSQSFGTCIFSGLVRDVSESYSDGSYSITVNCNNNSAYFDQGWLQTKPGLEQFNGALYDPLTPFNFEIDEANGLAPEVSKFELLPENAELLNTGYLKFTEGRHAGQIITSEKFYNSDFEPVEGMSKLTGTYSNISKKIFQVPDGSVYKWKKGIGTAFINQSGSPDGLINNKLLHERLAQVVEEDPFGGQDLVNVLSILICGEPYNLNTFLKTSLGNENGISVRTFDPSTDYFQGLMNLIKKQNKIWGNYLPFKKLDVDPASFSKQMSMQLMNYDKNTNIKKLQAQKAALLDNLMQIEGSAFVFDISDYSAPLTSQYNPIKTNNRAITFQLIKKIVELDAQIQLSEIAITSASLTEYNSSIAAIGSNLFCDQNVVLSGADSKALYKLTLAKQNELTKRRLWKVKGNTDQNLFIVGSEYDNDYDIQAILKTQAGNSDYINVSWLKPIQKIKEVASIIGMELFVNSQGHIEFRAPRYNRIPSSILFEMLRRKADDNVQIYPNFLEKTFENKIQATFNQIEIIEDQIRLRAIALGAHYFDNEDYQIESYLNGSLSTINNKFQFVTDKKGTLTNIRTAVSQMDNDYVEAYKPRTNPSTLSKLTGASLTDTVDGFFERKQSLVGNFQVAANTFNNFDIIQQSKTLKQAYKFYNSDQSFFKNQINQAESIRIRLSGKLGVPLDSASVKTIPQLLPNSQHGKLSATDVNALIKELDGFVTQRYDLLITSMNLIKSLDQAAKINSQDTSVFQKLLMPNLYGEQDIPEFLRNMVENELEDDYGFNSGKRFIIKESDIISMTYKEDTPEFTSVVVSGSELGGLAAGNGGFQMSNAGISQAWAVDYDLWRMYGSKEATGKHLPFFSNAETQLAPYAVYLLNQQRANIFRGEIEVRGNEFMQPGEVYYIQERGMLFYSRSVTHDFSYGNSFTTKLSLSYGHAPGEYIPTPLDVIGKNLYNGHHFNTGKYIVKRTGTIDKLKKTHINTFIYPNLSETDMTPVEQLYANDTGEKNRQVKADILAKVNLLLQTTLPVLNKGMKAITVRVYVSDDNGFNENIYLAATDIVRYLIKNGLPRSSIVGKDYNSNQLLPATVMVVNLNQESEIRNPSNLAMTYVKDDKFIKVIDNFDQDQTKVNKSYIQLKKMCNSIIDVWLETDIIANEAIVKSTIQSPSDKNKSTTKNLYLEEMRTHFNTLEYNKLIG